MKSLVCVLVAVASSYALSQGTPPTVVLDVQSVQGTIVKGLVKVDFAPGLHGYQNPPALEYQIPITVKGGPGVTVVKAQYPKGTPMRMAGEDKDSMVYAGQIAIPVELKLAHTGGSVSVVLGYQECTDQSCYPPSTVTASFTQQPLVRHPTPKPLVPVKKAVSPKSKSKLSAKARHKKKPKHKSAHFR